MTPIDQADIRKSTMTTPLASGPICAHMERGSNAGASPWKNIIAQTWTCKSIVVTFSCELNWTSFVLGFRAPCCRGAPSHLLAQLEVHVNRRDHVDRIAVQQRRLVHPVTHCFERRLLQQRVAA